MKPSVFLAATCIAVLFHQPIQIENAGDCPAFVAHQVGNSTAAVILQETNNPALTLVSQGNGTGLEVFKAGGTDGITCVECDVRARQVIAEWRSCIKAGGAIQFSGWDDPLEYHDVIRLGPEEEVMIGNPERDNSIRLRVNTGAVDIEAGGQLMMRIEDGRIRIRPGSLVEDL